MDKLIQLEQQITELKQQIDSMNTEKTNIEKMEYNFEQLKVENLNGVLHIGIRPGDELKIDDVFQQDTHQAEDLTIQGQELPDMAQGVRSEIDQYIKNVIPGTLKERSDAKGIDLSEENLQSIMDDMTKQSAGRIKLLVNHVKDTNVGGERQRDLHLQIADRIKADIYGAVDRYVEHFRKEDTS